MRGPASWLLLSTLALGGACGDGLDERGGQVQCSAENPKGLCPGGSTCLEGSCCPEASHCGTACCGVDQTCDGAVCADVCSATYPTGACPGMQVCLHEACCPSHKACGQACCGSDAVCRSGSCVQETGTPIDESPTRFWIRPNPVRFGVDSLGSPVMLVVVEIVGIGSKIVVDDVVHFTDNLQQVDHRLNVPIRVE